MSLIFMIILVFTWVDHLINKVVKSCLKSSPLFKKTKIMFMCQHFMKICIQKEIYSMIKKKLLTHICNIVTVGVFGHPTITLRVFLKQILKVLKKLI